MTLVAGIFFVVTRRLLALSSTLALRYPIKNWMGAFSLANGLHRVVSFCPLDFMRLSVDRRWRTMADCGRY